jgi:hypothetical protein
MRLIFLQLTYPKAYFISLIFLKFSCIFPFQSIVIGMLQATGCTTEESWFDSRKGKRFFCFPRHPDRFWGILSLLTNTYWRRCSFPLSIDIRTSIWPPTCLNAEFKKQWSYTFTAPCPFMVFTGPNLSLFGFRKLEWPRGLQEVKVPRFHDNGTG